MVEEISSEEDDATDIEREDRDVTQQMLIKARRTLLLTETLDSIDAEYHQAWTRVRQSLDRLMPHFRGPASSVCI